MTAGSKERTAQRSTLIVTNLTKLAGIVIGLHAGLDQSPDWRVIALAGLMVSGGQLSETFVLSVIDRIFGSQEGGR
jgi:hypothetical protein